jgi:hypothetical protein
MVANTDSVSTHGTPVPSSPSKVISGRKIPSMFAREDAGTWPTRTIRSDFRIYIQGYVKGTNTLIQWLYCSWEPMSHSHSFVYLFSFNQPLHFYNLKLQILDLACRPCRGTKSFTKCTHREYPRREVNHGRLARPKVLALCLGLRSSGFTEWNHPWTVGWLHSAKSMDLGPSAWCIVYLHIIHVNLFGRFMHYTPSTHISLYY